MAMYRAPHVADKSGGFIVEVVGQDGIIHHVGPFRLRAHAAHWIAQSDAPQSAGIPLGKPRSGTRPMSPSVTPLHRD